MELWEGSEYFVIQSILMPIVLCYPSKGRNHVL